MPNSPASRAGLRAKDVITSIDGRPVSDREEALAAFPRLKASQTIRFVVLRENRLIVVRVTAELRLEERAKR
jgi:S1-C subfamily serine protease